MKLWKRLLVGFVGVVVCVVTTVPVYAADRKLSEEDLFFYGMNGIYFYLPGRDNDGKTCFGTLMGSTVYEKVLSGLLSMGLNEVAAAGVYSNLMAEGLGSGGLLTHEYGTDSRDDIGTIYRDVYGNPVLNPVTETDVRDLYNPQVMHGIGPPGWSFNLRVWLLEVLEEYGVEKYATEWDESTGRYTYTGMSYDKMVEVVGEDEADKVLTAVLNYFDRLYIKNEYVSRGYSSAVQQSDINAQGLSKYGITAGMTLLEALNLVETPYEASQLFFTTGEMPGWSQFDEAQKVHASRADEGLELIRSAGLTASGATITCGGNGDIVATALELSWEGFGQHATTDPKPEYVQAMHVVDAWILPCGRDGICPYYGASCDQFVGTVMRYSGADPDFPLFFGGGTLPNYLKTNTDKYEQVDHNEDYANLQPGDIFITYENGDNHIMLFLGEIDGQLMQASASWGGRTGEHFAGINFTETAKDGHIRRYEVYRRINYSSSSNSNNNNNSCDNDSNSNHSSTGTMTCKSKTDKEFIADQNGQIEGYYVNIPNGATENTPIVLYLAGDGETMRQGQTIAQCGLSGTTTVSGQSCTWKQIIKSTEYMFNSSDFISVIPLGPGTSSGGWASQTSELAGLINGTWGSLEDYLSDCDGIGNREKYIMGMSNGAFGTWAMIESNPTLFKAAAPIAGGNYTYPNWSGASQFSHTRITAISDTNYNSNMKSIVNSIKTANPDMNPILAETPYDHDHITANLDYSVVFNCLLNNSCSSFGSNINIYKP